MVSKKVYKGKYTSSELSAVIISKLMGCHVTTTKKILYRIKETFGELTEEMVGMIIQEYRNKEDLKRL